MISSGYPYFVGNPPKNALRLWTSPVVFWEIILHNFYGKFVSEPRIIRIPSGLLLWMQKEAQVHPNMWFHVTAMLFMIVVATWISWIEKHGKEYTGSNGVLNCGTTPVYQGNLWSTGSNNHQQWHILDYSGVVFFFFIRINIQTHQPLNKMQAVSIVSI